MPRAETLLTLEVHQLEEMPPDEYCAHCGDENEPAYRWTFDVDDLEGQQNFEVIYCKSCVARYIRINFPWASYMAREI